MAAAMEEEREAEQAARQGQQVQSHQHHCVCLFSQGPMQAQLDSISERNQKHNKEICSTLRQIVLGSKMCLESICYSHCCSCPHSQTQHTVVLSVFFTPRIDITPMAILRASAHTLASIADAKL